MSSGLLLDFLDVVYFKCGRSKLVIFERRNIFKGCNTFLQRVQGCLCPAGQVQLAEKIAHMSTHSQFTNR